MPLTPIAPFFFSGMAAVSMRRNISFSLCMTMLSWSSKTPTKSRPSSGANLVAAVVLFATSNSPPSTTFNMDVLVANTSFLSFNAATDAIKRLSSLLASKLLTLSSGCPLSRNLPNGRSKTLIRCICPLSVKSASLSVFLQKMIWRLSASAASLLRSKVGISTTRP